MKTKLSNKSCISCEGKMTPLTKKEAEILLEQLADWILDDSGTEISKAFQFKNFYQTVGFINAIAWIVNQENHHPYLEISYNRCRVHFTTHSIQGLSESDFICAAKIDQLI